jgi:hypothetical protein
VSIDDLFWSDAPPPTRRGRRGRRVRELAAAVLRALGAALDSLATRLMHVQPSPARDEPLLEFHAEAGAPEGALYVNGQLVGHLRGVTRL